MRRFSVFFAITLLKPNLFVNSVPISNDISFNNLSDSITDPYGYNETQSSEDHVQFSSIQLTPMKLIVSPSVDPYEKITIRKLERTIREFLLLSFFSTNNDSGFHKSIGFYSEGKQDFRVNLEAIENNINNHDRRRALRGETLNENESILKKNHFMMKTTVIFQGGVDEPKQTALEDLVFKFIRDDSNHLIDLLEATNDQELEDILFVSISILHQDPLSSIITEEDERDSNNNETKEENEPVIAVTESIPELLDPETSKFVLYYFWIPSGCFFVLAVSLTFLAVIQGQRHKSHSSFLFLRNECDDATNGDDLSTLNNKSSVSDSDSPKMSMTTETVSGNSDSVISSLSSCSSSSMTNDDQVDNDYVFEEPEKESIKSAYEESDSSSIVSSGMDDSDIPQSATSSWIESWARSVVVVSDDPDHDSNMI